MVSTLEQIWTGRSLSSTWPGLTLTSLDSTREELGVGGFISQGQGEGEVMAISPMAVGGEGGEGGATLSIPPNQATSNMKPLLHHQVGLNLPHSTNPDLQVVEEGEAEAGEREVEDMVRVLKDRTALALGPMLEEEASCKLVTGLPKATVVEGGGAGCYMVMGCVLFAMHYSQSKMHFYLINNLTIH